MRFTGGAVAAVAAVLIAAPLAHAAPRTGSWWAGNSQLRLDFEVKRFGRGHILSGAIAEAQNGCAARKAELVGTGFLRGSRFSVRRQYLGGKVRQWLTGRFSSRGRASGTYRELDTRFNRRCDTGTIRWSARPKRRLAVRDGTWRNTAAGQQVSFLVQQRGRLMSQIRGDAVSCGAGTGQGFRGPAEWFLIPPNGAFSIPLDAVDGSVFNGRFLSTTTAAGTYRLIYTAQGGTPTCESGVQSWSARYG